MHRLAFLLPALLLAACAQPAPTGNVRTATAAEVAGCEYVKNISTTPGVFGPLAQAGLEDARNAALRSAAAIGSEHGGFRRGRARAQRSSGSRRSPYRC